VAGRKPRVSRDEQQGVTPLKGRRKKAGDGPEAGNGEGKGPARGYSWPPFEPGNTKSLVHGAYSERVVAPRAEALMTSVLEDAESPDHVRTPMFRFTLAAWCRAETVAGVLYEHIMSLSTEEMMTPRLAGTRSPVDLWKAADAHAANLRSKLGLDPVSYARIAKDLGIASKASEDALGRLAETGKSIVERREAEMRVIEGGEADGRTA
jgi:hypothetical protein